MKVALGVGVFWETYHECDSDGFGVLENPTNHSNAFVECPILCLPDGHENRFVNNGGVEATCVNEFGDALGVVSE